MENVRNLLQTVNSIEHDIKHGELQKVYMRVIEQEDVSPTLSIISFI